MIRTTFLFSFLSIFLINSSNAQKWVDLMQSEDPNFFEVQQEFDQYFDGRAYEKGKGYKQFLRWAWFMEPRVGADGKLFSADATWKAKQKWRMHNPINATRSASASNWTALGPNHYSPGNGWSPGTGRVNAVVQHPSIDSVLFIGAPAGGFWKSTDDGNTWSTTFDDMPVLGVSSIAVDPNNDDHILIGTGDDDAGDTYSIGILESFDQGLTWDSTGLIFSINQTRRVYEIIYYPGSSDTIFAATNSGLYRTNDAGQTWNTVQGGHIRDLEMKPGDPTTWYACSNSFFRSTDGGNTFSQVNMGLPTGGVTRGELAVSTADSSRVYILYGNSSDNGFNGVYRSDDFGQTFIQTASSPNLLGWAINGNDNGGQAWYDLAMDVDPNDPDKIYVGGVNLWESADGGFTWINNAHWLWPTNPADAYVHADIHILKFFKGELYAGTDGGIYRLNAGSGNSWTDLTAGLEISQFYRMGQSVQMPYRISAGAQDNGTMLSDSTIVWEQILGADGMESIIDYSNPDIIYGESQFGGIRRSTDGGQSFTFIGVGSENGYWVTPYVIDPNDPATLYSGYQNVWKTTDRGDNWSAISTWGGGTLRNLAVAPSDPNYIYAGTFTTLRRTTDGGSTWNTLAGVSGNVSYITVDENDPLKIWISVSGFNGNSKVHKSTDGGSSWTNITGNLPNIPANCIVHQFGSADGVYVGTDLGVFYLDDSLTAWEEYNTGLPNVIVDELEIQYDINKIRAATYGRGVWESDLYAPSALAPIATFASNALPYNCEGEAIQFSNSSKYGPSTFQWSFPGGSPSSSVDVNPLVTYNQVGEFDVELIATNGFGVDSSYQQNHVKIIPSPSGLTETYLEGFEDPNFPEVPGFSNVDWTISGVGYDRTSETAGEGQFSIKMDYASSNDRDELDVVSPTLDFSQVQNISISFKTAYGQTAANSGDQVWFYVSTDCGKTWNQRGVLIGALLSSVSGLVSQSYVPDSTEWRNRTYNLNSLSGQSNVMLRFRMVKSSGTSIYLDDIQFIFTTGLNDAATKQGARAYPNPFSDGFNIELDRKGQYDSWNLYNTIGERISSGSINGKFERVRVPDLDAGVYYLNLIGESNSVTINLVKD